MSFETLRLSVETQFNSSWTGTASSVDHGGNHDFTPPDGTPWVRLTTNVIGNENAQIGADFQRATGVITVQCFVKKDTGEKVLNEMIDEVSGIFQNKNFGGVRCFTTTPIRIGEIESWYQVNAKTDFHFDVFS